MALTERLFAVRKHPGEPVKALPPNLYTYWFVLENDKTKVREIGHDKHLSYKLAVEFGIPKRDFGWDRTGLTMIHVFSEADCDFLTELRFKKVDSADTFNLLSAKLCESERSFAGFILEDVLEELGMHR